MNFPQKIDFSLIKNENQDLYKEELSKVRIAFEGGVKLRDNLINFITKDDRESFEAYTKRLETANTKNYIYSSVKKKMSLLLKTEPKIRKAGVNKDKIDKFLYNVNGANKTFIQLVNEVIQEVLVAGYAGVYVENSGGNPFLSIVKREDIVNIRTVEGKIEGVAFLKKVPKKEVPFPVLEEHFNNYLYLVFGKQVAVYLEDSHSGDYFLEEEKEEEMCPLILFGENVSIEAAIPPYNILELSFNLIEIQTRKLKYANSMGIPYYIVKADDSQNEVKKALNSNQNAIKDAETLVLGLEENIQIETLPEAPYNALTNELKELKEDLKSEIYSFITSKTMTAAEAKIRLQETSAELKGFIQGLEDKFNEVLIVATNIMFGHLAYTPKVSITFNKDLDSLITDLEAIELGIKLVDDNIISRATLRDNIKDTNILKIERENEDEERKIEEEMGMLANSL